MPASPLPPHGFDARSVVLFAALTLGAGATVNARAAQGTLTTAAAATTTTSGAPPSASPPTLSPAARRAFERADSNRDGQLSAQEAQRLPAISERFEQLDTNHDGQLSHEEFHHGS